LEALLGLRHGVAHDYVVDAAGVEGGHRGHEVLDNIGREVVGPGKAENAPRGFADGCAVASYDISLLRHY